MRNESGYLTVRQIRDRFSISHTTMWRWQNDEALHFPKPIKIGQRLYFSKDDIERWEAEFRDPERPH